jgi:hypothetical protein
MELEWYIVALGATLFVMVGFSIGVFVCDYFAGRYWLNQLATQKKTHEIEIESAKIASFNSGVMALRSRLLNTKGIDASDVEDIEVAASEELEEWMGHRKERY